MVVADARADPRFADNALVTGPPWIRFYCGAPLIAPCGIAIGSLCVIDTRPRSTPPLHTQQTLRDLAAMVIERLERRRAERERDHAEALLATTSASAFVLTGARIVEANAAAVDLLEIRRADLQGRPLTSLVAGLTHGRDGWRHDAGEREGELALLATVRVSRGDGSTFPARLRIRAADPADGARAVATLEDLSEQRRVEAMVARLAVADGVTGLANRDAFDDRLAAASEAASGDDGGLALIRLDAAGLDGLRERSGHRAGDRVLAELGARLRAAAGCRETAAHLGDGRFALVVPRAAVAVEVARRCRELAARLAAPVAVDDELCFPVVTIGVALHADEPSDASGLSAAAELALATAGAGGEEAVRFYTPAMRVAARRRSRLEARLRDALADDGLQLAFQPKFDVTGRRMTGSEALLRWRDDELGTVSPAELIPIAEATGLIRPIGTHVLRAACREATRWSELPVSVNLSPTQFRAADLVETVRDALAVTGLAPHRLELELTEGVLVDDPAQAVGVMERLKALGVGLALDDFGTGYASLQYLRLFPFDRVKLDRSFIQAVGTDPEAAAIVRAFLDLSRAVGTTSTVEGVETTEQLAWLRRHGCDEVQGFLLARPMPAADLRRVLAGAETPLSVPA